MQRTLSMIDEQSKTQMLYKLQCKMFQKTYLGKKEKNMNELVVVLGQKKIYLRIYNVLEISTEANHDKTTGIKLTLVMWFEKVRVFIIQEHNFSALHMGFSIEIG